jgi:uracil phosphoribosyltransferase/phosphoserine phosphatase/adenylate kinase
MSRQTIAAELANKTISKNPKVVGLFGLPGCGKSFIFDQLKKNNGDHLYFEGSSEIDRACDGGLEAFKKMNEQEKTKIRTIAINGIRSACSKAGKLGVVVGHFSFWEEGDGKELPLQSVLTRSDFDTFTHIIYLSVDPEVIAQRRKDDQLRIRPKVSTEDLQTWQTKEIEQLRFLCRRNGIFFIRCSMASPYVVSTLLVSLFGYDESFNTPFAYEKLEAAIGPDPSEVRTVVVMDADKTLTPSDTGTLLWDKYLPAILGQAFGEYDGRTLRDVFDSRFQYSYSGFRQFALLYEEAASDETHEKACDLIAAEVEIYPELKQLLHSLTESSRTKAVVVTCGLRRVWEKILAKAGLNGKVTVIGGGRLNDRLVVYPELKGILVDRLRDEHRKTVWAFGDSPLDLPMLEKADHAIVIVGEESRRSRSMESKLEKAITHRGLKARQILFPNTVKPRLDEKTLPVVTVNQLEISSAPGGRFHYHHVTDRPATKLLSTPMRSKSVQGPALREAHRQAGRYLALNLVAEAIGTESFDAHDVHGNATTGWQLKSERFTTIVALMRAGEPLAQGINDVFPRASFLHHKEKQDIQDAQLQNQKTIILVDAVVNTGQTMMQFVSWIHQAHPHVNIAVVAGVVQSHFFSSQLLADTLSHIEKDIHFIYLRHSDNKYTGKGPTDTGHRLFNTTHLD